MNKINIQGINWDEKSSFQRGPAKAPALIRKALYSDSMNLCTELGTTIENDLITDNGDFNIEDYFDIATITQKNIENGEKLLTLGGDHSITFPIIKAFHDHYPKLDILHIDAHADLYHDYEGDPYSHACPFARIMENGYAVKLVQVGIRTLNPHQASQAKKFDVDIHEAISNIPAPKKKLKGKVIEAVEKGYYLNNKVIRFAKVVVGQ